MLYRLRAENLGVFRHVELSLGEGLTALTGESGAGKTLLLRAVDLALGGRWSPRRGRAWASSWRVSLDLTVKGRLHRVERWLDRQGRSQYALDGEPCGREAVWALREEAAVFLHQGAAFRLREEGVWAFLERHPAVSQARRDVEALAQTYARVREERRRYGPEDVRSRQARQEELRELWERVERVRPKPGESQRLAEELQRLRQLRHLAQAVSQAREALSPEGEGPGVRELLAAADQALAEVGGLDDQLDGFRQELTLLADAAAQLARGMERFLDTLEPDPAREAQLAARLQEIGALFRRYGVANEEELWALRERAQEEWEALAQGEEKAQALAREEEAALVAWRAAAHRLSEARRQAAAELTARAAQELADLALPHARLRVEVHPQPHRPPSPQGFDEAWVRFQANPDGPLLPLEEAASGGEAARVALALSLALAEPGLDPAQEPAWLLDEAEAGLGGEAAWAVARSLFRFAQTRQVVAVTHQAPLAALADRLWVVEKEVVDGAAVSRVRPAEGEERVVELARLLAGDGLAARRHARALMGEAQALRARLEQDRPAARP
jgi:DNA repair protein RecN (Recombination protein N)